MHRPSSHHSRLLSTHPRGDRCPANALPALLPEVGPHGCQLAPGQRGIASQDRLRDLLERALATTGDSRAADAFMDAVQVWSSGGLGWNSWTEGGRARRMMV